MQTWHLIRGHDKRFKQGHPWVYSNELAHSPQNVEPGEMVELRDCRGNFLARGTGHPHSLIAFRQLTRDPALTNPLTTDALFQTLKQAGQLRQKLGVLQSTHRLVFAEADNLSGLIIDCYVTQIHALFVIQPHTSGMERALPSIVDALKEYVHRFYNEIVGIPWSQTVVIINRRASLRTLENLPVSGCEVVSKSSGDIDLNLVSTRSPSNLFLKNTNYEIKVNLLEGQKTGLFLDQTDNIARLCSLVKKSDRTGTIHILDLFSYVGRWGLELSMALKDVGQCTKVTLVDTSAKALELATLNLSRYDIQHKIIKMDLIKDDWSDLNQSCYTIVICDPPALIKSRKHMPQGQKAYIKLNKQALNCTEPGGIFMSSSCSSLVSESDFKNILKKSEYLSQKKVHWILRGQQALDHPVLSNFPEGNYLKCQIGFVE